MKRLLVLATAAALAGCAANPGEPARTSGDAGSRASTADTALVVDDEIAAKCGLPTAHFDFDSDNIKEGDSPALDALAECFVTGPLSGRAMKLVGHADPRGETEYNFALGQRRAGNVASYLERRGLGSGRIETSSLGELEARGTSPESWARDRKVEVLLAH